MSGSPPAVTIFSDTHATDGAVGPSAYLWSDPANWSNGLPVSGEVVVATGTGTDDLGGLVLSGVTLAANAILYTVATLDADLLDLGDNATLVADSEFGTPSLVTLGTLTGDGVGDASADTGAVVAALGDGAIAAVTGADPGVYYAATDGGTVRLSGAADPGSLFAFLVPSEPGTIAFDAPGPTVASEILGLGTGDTIEVPGTAISGVVIGAASVTITSDTGRYSFPDVVYGSTLTGYAATRDAATGLEAVTFRGFTSFVETEPSGGPYLWTDRANWTNGVPKGGDGVIIAGPATDNIAVLDLAALTARAGTALTVAGDLEVTSLDISSGATVTLLAGGGTARDLTLGRVSDGGTLVVSGAGAEIAVGVDAGAAYAIRDHGTLLLEGAADAGSIITFDTAANGGTLAFAAPGGPIGTAIIVLAGGDVVEVQGGSITRVDVGEESLIIETNVGAYHFDSVTFSGSIGGYDIGFDAGTGLASVTLTLACFAAGTAIDTPDGPRAVERLAVGDLVLTAAGGARPVRWTGHRHLVCRRHARPETVLPVRIRAHAFGPDLPRRDLYLSPDHALFAEGVLVPVRYLIDGESVAQMGWEEVIYWHVELDRHDILLAEGLPAESYLDLDGRAAFVGQAGPIALHPDFGAAPQGMAREAMGYAPLRVSGPEVARLRRQLHIRARGLAHLGITLPSPGRSV